MCIPHDESPWHNNQTYVDTLNKEAIDEFIKSLMKRINPLSVTNLTK